MTTLAFTLLCCSSLYADCSFKIINHSTDDFLKLNTRAWIGDLVVPLCSQNPNKDAETLANCATDPTETLFMHPHAEDTCSQVNNHPMFLDFFTTQRVCQSKNQVTRDKQVVLSYPEDFSC